jgi:predicted transcriptional regulator
MAAQQVLVEIVRGTSQLSMLAAGLQQDRNAVVMAVQCLKHRGLVTTTAPGEYEATDAGRQFLAEGRTVASGQGSARPRQKTRGLRQRAWWVLRARGMVTIPDLLSTLADGSEKNAAKNISRYLSALVKTGFVTELETRAPGAALTSNGYKRYKLTKNSGRQAPVLRQTRGEVYDPNSGEVIPLVMEDAP